MNTIRNVLASITILAATSAASGTDLDAGGAQFDWSGSYVGLQGGYGWTDIGVHGFAHPDFNGGTLGAHIGSNWQSGNLVYGVEADLNHNWNSFTSTIGGVTAAAGTDWQGSLRARLGYAMDRTLFYGTGGLAMANVYFKSNVGDVSTTAGGWTVGAGIEHAFTDSWSARAEYVYSDYGNISLGGQDLFAHDSALRIGVSYRF